MIREVPSPEPAIPLFQFTEEWHNNCKSTGKLPHQDGDVYRKAEHVACPICFPKEIFE